MLLENKFAFVSGGSDGIGASSAIALSNAGCSVIITGRDKRKLQSVLSRLDLSINQKHGKIVTDYDNPDNMIEDVRKYKDLNSLEFDILINNSGGPNQGRIVNASINEFKSTFDRHLICNHLLFQDFYGYMKENKFGRVINIISTSIRQPIKGLGVSNTIRGAVASWAKTLSYEVAQDGITVNNILPGFTKTARLDSIISSKSENFGISKDDVISNMISTIPIGRFGRPEEIADLLVFISSENASYINGVSIQVDGGRLETI